MKRFADIAFAVCLVLFLAAVALGTFLRNSGETSFFENRALAERPALTAEDWQRELNCPAALRRELVCLLADARGQVLRTERRAVTCPVLSALEVGLMDFTGDFDPAARHPEDDRMVYFTLLDGEGQAVSEGCELFSLPKHFAFQPPRIRWEIAQEADRFRITLDCDAAAWGVCLELSQADGRFSDNWFALLPGRPRAVYLSKDALSAPLSLDQVQRQLTVRSVYDMG